MVKKRLYPNYLIIFVTICILYSCKTKNIAPDYTTSKKIPKREFRGAWLQTAWQDRYKSMSSDQMRNYFTTVLDQLHEAGINAVIFQARPQADAFYQSRLEPWSSFMTGVQGRGFADGFDPLAFLVEEAHKRNMELHVWLNPYRAKLSEGQKLNSNHLYYRRPDLFLNYGNQLCFDPGIPENRKYICGIVNDIVTRYDIDAIHMDDYFYPYPIKGRPFPDDNSFRNYGLSQGYAWNQKDEWRRNNINMLIKEIKQTVVSTKPWVRFGISSFGIYRNKRSTPDGSGSETNGLQNYDDLYADIKLWVKNKWIDYNIPQIYWEIGHKSADYTTLLHWWANNNCGQPLYIGQDATRSMDLKMPSGENQLNEKMRLQRSIDNIEGSSFWSGYTIAENYKGIANNLKNGYYKYPALIPAYTHMSKKIPREVQFLKEVYTPTSHFLEWSKAHDNSKEKVQYFVVYRFKNGEVFNIEDPRHIVAITRDTKHILPYEGGKNKYTYIVTAVDVYHNESKGRLKSVKL